MIGAINQHESSQLAQNPDQPLTTDICSAPTIDGTVLFSIHTAMMLALAVVIPLLLALGAPGQLIEVTVPRRTDGSRGQE